MPVEAKNNNRGSFDQLVDDIKGVLHNYVNREVNIVAHRLATECDNVLLEQHALH